MADKDDLKSGWAFSEISIFYNAIYKCNLHFMLNFVYILVDF